MMYLVKNNKQYYSYFIGEFYFDKSFANAVLFASKEKAEQIANQYDGAVVIPYSKNER